MIDCVSRENAMTVALELSKGKWKDKYVKRRVMEIPPVDVSEFLPIKEKCCYCPMCEICPKDDNNYPDVVEREDYEQMKYLVHNLVNSLPSRKCGEWIGAGFLTSECSKCHHLFHELEAMNFCPNCGADMRKKKDNE